MTAAIAARELREAARHMEGLANALTRAADAIESIDPNTGPYTSLALPACCPSRDRFRRLAKQIADAGGDAVRNGSVWIVSREAWAAHRSAPSARARAKQEPHPGAADDIAAVERAGLRVVRGPK